MLSTACLGIAGLPGDWQIRETPVATHLTAVASAPGQLIAVGHDATILTSGNGAAWDAVPYSGSGDFHCITFAKGLYVAGGTLDCLLAVSSDGLNWTPVQSTDGSRAHLGITYGGGRFVVVGRGGLLVPTRILSSTNGIDWQPADVPPTTNFLRAVTFGNGKYVAVGDQGTILTSADAITWTLQISGTEHLLRSVMFTGREFLAGGDSSTLLTSGDGISWVSVPFSSFDVRGLATSGTAVVGVGALGAEGRLQSSTNGLSWPGAGEPFTRRLNAVIHFAFGKFFAVGNDGLIIESGAVADAPVNVWLKSTDGYWHEGPWSLGHMPSWSDTHIVFTNGGSKTLEINATTTRDYPESLHIRALSLFFQPEDATNTLLLNDAGFDVPLTIDSGLRVPPNLSLRSFNSAIEGSGMELSGDATFSDTHALFTGSVGMGMIGPANVVQSNGYFAAATLGVGSNNRGTWTQYGGTNEFRQLGIRSGSSYDLYGGLLNFTPFVYNNVTVGTLGNSNGAALRIHNGSLIASGPIVLYDGQLALRDGLLESFTITAFNGDVIQSGGTNRTPYVEVPNSTLGGRATYVLNDGRLETTQVRLGQPRGAIGSFIQHGGLHIASRSIDSFSDIETPMPTVRGTYELTGGIVSAPRMYVGGAFSQSGGTNEVGEMFVNIYNLSGGTLNTSNMSVGPAASGFTQTGGKHYLSGNFGLVGNYTLQDGLFSAQRIALGGTLTLAGGTVSLPNLALYGGKIAANGNYTFGRITGDGRGTLDFQNGETVLRFYQSSDAEWGASEFLIVTNWTPGSDQLFIGHNQAGLTAAQLSRIRFANPGGFSPGLYSARILSTGEVVPVPRFVSHQRTTNGLVLSWPEGYRLMTATNVAGPYSLITNAISPYTASYHTDPQRFFIVGNEN